MDLKTVLDLYAQGRADLLDIALALTAEFGLGDPEQIQRASEIVKRDCK